MKKRLDILMTQRGLASSRQKAQALILSGNVRVNGVMAEKNGQESDEDAQIEIVEKLRYVSRGGLKLERAVERFHLDLAGCLCADVGASTGGFTDCMLQNGAKKVYAIDVGYGQLDYKLRIDPRVVVRERTNARFIQPGDFDEPLDFAGIDASFISLRLLLPPLSPCMAEGGRLVALIKPQFEAGRGQVGKKGVVRDARVHADVIRNIVGFAREMGYAVNGLDYSPITGPEGNIEFLLALSPGQSDDYAPDIENIVAEAHIAHKK